MSSVVIEGTWEELERHKAELVGLRLRLIVQPATPKPRKLHAPAKKMTKGVRPSRVSAMGKYAGILNSEEFMRHKQAEIDLEDRARG